MCLSYFSSNLITLGTQLRRTITCLIAWLRRPSESEDAPLEWMSFEKENELRGKLRAERLMLLKRQFKI
jgi:hypothetical protein